MGLRDFDEAALIATEHNLLRDLPCFEMRMLSLWRGDPTLQPWAEEHDRALSLLPSPTFLAAFPSERGSYDVADGLRAWIGLFEHEDLWSVCNQFAPAGVTLGTFWGDVAEEVVRAGTTRIELTADAELLEIAVSSRLVRRVDGAAVGFDPSGILNVVVSSTLAEIEEVVESLNNAPRKTDNEVTVHAAGGLVDAFVDSAGSVRDLQSVIERHPGPLGEAGREASREVALKLSEAAQRLSTALHNAGIFDAAEDVLVQMLNVQLGEAELEEVQDGLAIVRVVWARRDFSTAMEAKNFPLARQALNRIIQHSRDETEQQHARGLLAKLDAVQHPPILRRVWNTFGGLLVSAAVIGGIAALANLGEGDSDSSSSRASPLSIPTARAAPTLVGSRPVRTPTARATPTATYRDPRVGDCIRTGSGTSFVLKVVSCAGANDGKVLAIGRISSSSYPSSTALDRDAERICPSDTTSYVYPTREGWSAGDRELLCIKD